MDILRQPFFFLLNIQCFKLQNANLYILSHLNLTGTFLSLTVGLTYCPDATGYRRVHFWGCQPGLGGWYLPALVPIVPEQPLWCTPVCLRCCFLCFACALMCKRMGTLWDLTAFPLCRKRDGLREIRRLLKITELAGDRSHDSTLHFWLQHSMCSFSHTMPPLSYALPSWSITKSDRGDQINLHKLYARCKYSLKASIAQWLKTKTLGWWRPGAGTRAG